MPQLPKDVIKKRAKILRNLGTTNMKTYLKKQIGSKARVLIEQVKDNISLGKSQHFTKVQISQILNKGSIVDCIITSVHENFLKATLIS